LRAFRKLDGRSCPGEHKCTTEGTGEIGGFYGRKNERTLENYCHNQVPTPLNGLKSGCPLYETKPENVPPSLMGAIDAAETLRRYKQRGCLPHIEEMTAWEFCCFDTAEEASEKIESEAIKDASGDKKGSGNSDTNKQTPLGEFGKGKEGGAFKDW
jgi:hypothetical protein